MKKLLLLFIVLPFLISCEKEEQPTEVTFTLNITGFKITVDDFGGLKSTQVDFDSFTHKYQPGELIFTNSAGVSYIFNTGTYPINVFSITLPVGDYMLTGTSGDIGKYGNSAMSLTIDSQEITIESSTTQIDVIVTPTCGLILVADENSLVDRAYMDEANPENFSTEGIFWYRYFRPSGVYARIAKKDGAVLSILTQNLETGHIYQIEVTDSGTTQDINLNPSFTKDIPVIW